MGTESRLDGLFLLLTAVTLLAPHGESLRILEVGVPAYIARGETAHLVCRYDLEQDRLYTVSWYKDNEHIYRFASRAKKSIYVDYIQIDVSRSSDQELWLESVSLEATGVYRCEVNTDGPEFKSVFDGAYMEVIAAPGGPPRIQAKEEFDGERDSLLLNCTAAHSHPPATIHWLLNDRPVRPESGPTHLAARDGLTATRSTLRLELLPELFSRGTTRVRCVARVQTSASARQHFEDTRETQFFVVGVGSSVHERRAPMLLALLLPLLLVAISGGSSTLPAWDQ